MIDDYSLMTMNIQQGVSTDLLLQGNNSHFRLEIGDTLIRIAEMMEVMRKSLYLY